MMHPGDVGCSTLLRHKDVACGEGKCFLQIAVGKALL